MVVAQACVADRNEQTAALPVAQGPQCPAEHFGYATGIEELLADRLARPHGAATASAGTAIRRRAESAPSNRAKRSSDVSIAGVLCCSAFSVASWRASRVLAGPCTRVRLSALWRRVVMAWSHPRDLLRGSKRC